MTQDAVLSYDKLGSFGKAGVRSHFQTENGS
jgi:hypothetical protein